MARYVKSGTVNTVQEINSELEKIATAQDEFLTRDGEAPNEMKNTLDMNSNRITNLPAPNSPNEPLRFIDAIGGIAFTVSTDEALVFDNIAEMKLADLSVGQTARCNRYYNGGDLVAGLLFDIQESVDVDGYIDHALANGNFAKLIFNNQIFLSQAGGLRDSEVDSGVIINAALSKLFITRGHLIIDGKFTHSTPLSIPTFANITGYGQDNSILTFNGLDSLWAVNATDGVAQRISIKNLSFRGSTTSKKIFNGLGVRYSNFLSVSFANCLICYQVELSWGVSFKNCSFKCGFDTGIVPVGSTGVVMKKGGASNSIVFSSCILSFNALAVDAGGAGRNIVFSDACTFEGNETVFSFTGLGSSKGFVVRECYFEGNEVNHFYIDNSLGARDDQISIEENYFDITSGINAGVVTVGTIGTGVSSLVLKNNHIEQLVLDPNPVNPYVVYFTTSSTNFNIQYESNHNFKVSGAGALPIEHVNWGNIDFRTFSSNIPYEPEYKNNSVSPNNLFAPVTGKENLKIYIRNGTATMTGNVVDAGNVFAGLLDIVTIPFTLSSPSGQYPIICHQRDAGNVSTVLGLIKGLSISVSFDVATTPVYISASWPLQNGAYA